MEEGSPVSQHLQDSVIFLCITDEKFLGLVRPVVDPSFFSSRAAALCCSICFSFFDTLRTAPKNHFHDEAVKRAASLDDGEREVFSKYLERFTSFHTPNPEYVLGRVSDFVRARELEKAAVEFADLVERGEFTRAETLMYGALKSGIHTQSVGKLYFDDFSGVVSRTGESRLLMRTGIRHLDGIIGGYKRQQFVCFLGGYKGGKSWCCVHLGKAALLRGLNVVYITHEMPEEEVETRFDMAIGGLVRGSEPREVRIRTYDLTSRVFGEHTEIRPPAADLRAVKRARRQASRFGGRLVIRKYPMGACSMLEVDRFLRYLEASEGMSVDVLINDYADIMMPVDGRKDLRHQINETYIWHKRIADERGILVVTVSQSTREALRRARVSVRDFAEDIRKAGNVDLAIAICQTEEQAQEEQALLHVVANRSGFQDRGCIIGQCLDIGQFALWSAPNIRGDSDATGDTGSV